MALGINLVGKGGATATYHVVDDIKTVKKDLMTWNVWGYIDHDERHGKGRTLTRYTFSKAITIEQYDAGVMPGTLYGWTKEQAPEGCEGVIVFENASNI